MASKTYKTYSKFNNKETSASRAFDEAVNNKNLPPVPIKAEKSKWGDTSFTRVREDDPFSVTLQKVKVENETVDPFTFDLEEDGTVKPKPPVNNNTSASNTNAGLGRPAINVGKGQPKQSQLEPQPKITKAEDDDLDSEPVMFKRPLKTYSRSVKKEKVFDEVSTTQNTSEDTEEEENEAGSSKDVPEEPHVPFSQRTDVFSDNVEDDNSYVPDDSGIDGRNKAKPKFTSKTHILQSDDDDSGGATVLNFRSPFMDPAVYGRFNYKPQEEDPVGRMNNSKVLQQSEIKHGKGSTLIVICSPKPPAEGKPKLHPVRTYKVRDPRDRKDYDPQPTEEPEYETIPPKPIIIRQRRRPQKRKNTSTAPALQAQPVQPEQPPAPVEIEPQEPLKVQSVSAIKQEPQYAARRSTRNSDSKPRYNKIFKSRNKIKEEEELKMETDSQESTSVLDFPESETSENTVSQQGETAKASDDAFGFADIAEETEKSEEEGERQATSDQAEEQEEALEEPPVKHKRLMDIQEAEAEMDSQSSEGEMESSQELESSQESVGSTEFKKPSKERKIFKSKNSRHTDGALKKSSQSPKKSPAKATYNMRSWQDDFDEEERNKNIKLEDLNVVSGPPKLTRYVPQERKEKESTPPVDPPKLTRAVHWPDKHGDEAYTSVHINKEHKQLYTVVKNVKEAHECQEHGETQEFSDDVEYLLSGIQEGEPMSTRCLSCIGLAQKSILPAFRMHLRAHGTVAKIFGHLKDAVSDPSLSLCTALLMFMLSRDRLNMDLDRQSLDLMLKLLAVDNQEEQSVTLMGKRTLNRNKDRAKEVYEQWKAEGGGTNQPDVEHVTTGNLAMESLLSLTSRRAGEWFKEELRTLGALDHIVDTVCSCIEALGDDTTLITDSALENMKKIDRCLRVLENVSFVNVDNQLYLISYKAGILITSLCRALAICEKCFPVYPVTSSENVDKDSTGYILYSCVLAILRVLINVTHENEFGCTKVGDQVEFITTVLTCILDTPQHVPIDFRFDMLVLGLGLLINMVEHCEVNRRRLIDAEIRRSYETSPENNNKVPATKALTEVFCVRFEVAKKMEEQDFGEPTTPQTSPNKSGEWRESDSGIEWVVSSASKNGNKSMMDKTSTEDQDNNRVENLDDEETFTKALHRAGKHMENSIIASYVALLLGCLIQDNSMYVSHVKEHLPNGQFDDLITILKKFLGFMNLTSAIGSTGGKSIAHVIEVLEGC